MDTFEINKIAGAVLFTLLMVLGVKSLAGAVFHAEQPQKPGYPVQLAAHTPAAEQPKAKPEPPKIDLPALLAKANVERGQTAAKKCGLCHTFKKGGANKIGPNLYDILGRKMGAVEGYKYSNAVVAMNGDDKAWGYAELDGFLASPKTFVKGTKMIFPGVKKPRDRANLIAYLRSLSGAPKPLPEPAEKQTSGTTIDKIKQQARDAAQKAKDAVEGAAEKTKEVVKDATDGVKDAAGKAKDAVEGAAQKAKDAIDPPPGTPNEPAQPPAPAQTPEKSN